MVANLLKRRSLISFDIGAAGVRACQLRRVGSTLRLAEALDVAVDNTGAGRDQRTTMSRAARLVQQGAFSGRSVGLVLSPPAVQFHALRVPTKILSYAPKQVHDALAWEIARETRGEAGDLEVRYWPLPTGNQEGLNVMAVALPTTEARGWVQAFAEHDLQLERIDVSPCALARVTQWQWRPESSAAWAVCDIGAQRTVLTVCIGAAPVYVRTIMVGSAKWTRALAQVFGISEREAEALKRKSAVPQFARVVAGGGGTPTDADELGDIVFGALRDSLDALVREIGACFTYTLSNYPEAQVRGVFLRGGGAQLSGMGAYLRRELDAPVIGPDMDADGQRDACAAHFGTGPALSTALGGALLAWEGR